MSLLAGQTGRLGLQGSALPLRPDFPCLRALGTPFIPELAQGLVPLFLVPLPGYRIPESWWAWEEPQGSSLWVSGDKVSKAAGLQVPGVT